jgi:hypothetical protein
VSVWKVRGEYNPADLFTKHIASHDKVCQLVNLFSCYYSGGRAAAAPTLRTTRMTKDTLGDLLDRGARQGEELEDILDGECNVADFQEQLSAPEPDHEGLPHQLEIDARDKFYPQAPRLDGNDPHSNHYDDQRNSPEQLNDYDHDIQDMIEQAGLAIAQQVKDEMLIQGRRRRPV